MKPTIYASLMSSDDEDVFFVGPMFYEITWERHEMLYAWLQQIHLNRGQPLDIFLEEPMEIGFTEFARMYHLYLGGVAPKVIGKGIRGYEDFKPALPFLRQASEALGHGMVLSLSKRS